MLPSTVTCAALAFLRLVLPPPALQEDDPDAVFKTVARRSSAPWIHGVKVAQTDPLRLEVYSKDGSLSDWTPEAGIQQNSSILLAPNEGFPVSPVFGFVYKVHFQFECERVSMPGLTLQTEVDFLKPAFPHPEPPPIDGPRDVFSSQDGRVLVFARTGGSPAQAGDVEIVSLPPDSDGPWRMHSLAGVPARGEIQLSATGRLIAYGAREQVRLFTETGEPRGSPLSAEHGFRLASDGDCIALFSHEAVQFIDLEAPVSQEPVSTVAVTSPVLDVQFQGAFALILTRDRAILKNWASSAGPLWNKPAEQLGPGTNQSAGLGVINGNLVAAIGRLEVLQRPARRGSNHEDGIAQAHVLVFGADGQSLEFSHSFETRQWAQGFPRVRVLGSVRRVLVETRDVALISNPIP